jgi:hypothetical protein
MRPALRRAHAKNLRTPNRPLAKQKPFRPKADIRQSIHEVALSTNKFTHRQALSLNPTTPLGCGGKA